MCTYSMVVDGWRDRQGPNFIPWTPNYPDPGTAQQMLEILRRLDEIDKKLGAKDCKLNESEKIAFEQKLQERAGPARTE